ncbi:MAG: hypothetical protein PUC23_03560 [bacterium]|nr:hypothetical protein [bacterium]
MKIYQLHHYHGSYEDFHDMIIGSYLKKDRAEEEKAKLDDKEKKLEEQGNKCAECPILYSDSLDVVDKYPNYCSEAKLEESEYGVECDNYYIYWGEDSFEIKEVEVEE